MSGSRDRILADIRARLGRGPLDAAEAAALEARLAAPAPNTIPARTRLDRPALIDLFVEKAEAAAATVARIPALDDVPAAVADYLAGENLPTRLRLAPDPALDGIPWQARPMLEIARGAADPGDPVSLTPVFAAVAETGTLMLVSGPATPTTLNFLPETHIALVRAEQVVGPFEDAWRRLREATRGAAGFPRTVNFVTGPSRSADIEQKLQMGAHGPRRLHIVLVEGADGDGDGRGR